MKTITTKDVKNVGSGWSTLLIKGDCLEVMAELAKLNIAVDMVFTDPPYG